MRGARSVNYFLSVPQSKDPVTVSDISLASADYPKTKHIGNFALTCFRSANTALQFSVLSAFETRYVCSAKKRACSSAVRAGDS
jgi:hypothetical protein